MSKKDNLIAYSIGILLIVMTIIPIVLAIMTFDFSKLVLMFGVVLGAIGLAYVLMIISRYDGCF